VFIRIFRDYTNFSNAVTGADGRLVYETRAQRDDIFLEIKPDTLPFQAGQKYQINVANKSGYFSVSIAAKGEMEVEQQPLLTSQVLFDKVAIAVREGGLSAVHQGGENFIMRGRGNHDLIIQQTLEWMQKHYSVAAIASLLESYNERQLVVTGNVPRDTAILYISQVVIGGMRIVYPSMIAGEAIKQLVARAEEYYHADRWPELFAILRGNLPIIDEDEPEEYRGTFYIGVCNLAKLNNQPELLIYAYHEAPESRSKEKYRAEYTNWLASSFEMDIQPVVVMSLEGRPLTSKIIFSWIINTLPS